MSPGFDPGEPFSGVEIAAAMARLHEESERYLAAIPAVEFAAPQGGKWSIDGLHATLAGYFTAEHRPVVDGYAVPPQ